MIRGIALMMEAVCNSETSVYFNETARRCIPEGYHLHTRCRGNLISYVFVLHLSYFYVHNFGTFCISDVYKGKGTFLSNSLKFLKDNTF
jgi:hypothetical protein